MSTQAPFFWAVILVIDNSIELDDCICDLKFLFLETMTKWEVEGRWLVGRGHFNAAQTGFCRNSLSGLRAMGSFSVHFQDSHRST